MKCPNCGRTGYREARQCPKLGGEPICIDCCKSCEYYGRDGIICHWYLETQNTNTDQEIERLNRRITHLMNQAEKLYKTKPWVAEQKEVDARDLKREKMRLENEKNHGTYERPYSDREETPREGKRDR